MPASQAYGSSNFNSDGTPKANTFMRSPMGANVQTAVETIPTTSLDDVADFFALHAVPAGKTLLQWVYEGTDGDSGGPTLDGDLVLRTVDKAGNVTDTTLVDTSARGAATYLGVATSATPRTFILGTAGSPGVLVPGDADDIALVGIKLMAVAATPVAITAYSALTFK